MSFQLHIEFIQKLNHAIPLKLKCSQLSHFWQLLLLLAQLLQDTKGTHYGFFLLYQTRA